MDALLFVSKQQHVAMVVQDVVHAHAKLVFLEDIV